MINSVFAIYGTGGCAKELMPCARDTLIAQTISPSHLYFIDDNKSASILNGQIVLSFDEFLKMNANEKYIAIGIANSMVRERLVAKVMASNVNHWFLNDQAYLMDGSTIGEGGLLSRHVVIGSNARIGKFFQANLYSYVAHDCIIGDYVTLAPRANINGNVIVEDHVYIGTGALIKQGSPDKPLRIGKGAVIGMGAVVTKDVAPGVTVVGNPARPLVKMA